MKKIIHLIITSLFLINGAKAQLDNFETINWASLQLKGKVKKITEYFFKAQDKFGELQKDDKELYSEYYFFNEKGLTTEHKSGLKWIMKYDNFGNKIDQTAYNTREDKTEYIWSKKVWVYDKTEKLSEQNSYEKDGNLSNKILYNYDVSGNLIEQNSYGKDGNLSSKTLYTYNKDGKLIEQNLYDKDGNAVGKSLYTYGDKGRILKENYYNKYSTQSSMTTAKMYSYDINGNLSQKLEYRSSSNLINGNTVIEKWTGIENYKYNGKSELIEYTYTTGFENQKSSIEIIKYEFDSNSNWIRKIDYNKPNSDYKISIREREIIYY